ncbi:PanC Panthothenate synthetase [Candidatus Nanopelagicaceae bacterium]
MKIVTSASELDDGCTFIPTMGAFHAGHASLFQLARTKSDFVVASIFVNPLQFENSTDLDLYPRTPDQDIELAAAAGVTHLWLPTQNEIYPENFTKVSAGPIGENFEGANRTGHFDGVVTVVSRLFQLVRPIRAIFGEKDFQQLALIKELARRNFKEIEILAAPTIRESDGLALSSRNIRLDQGDRAEATAIYKALLAAKESKNNASARAAMHQVFNEVPAFKLDYAQIVDEDNFAIATDSTPNRRAIIAGWLNGVRLIDNMQMSPALISAGAR